MHNLVLPNGAAIRCLSRANALLIYDELFRDQVYFRHGIEVGEGACIFDVGANIGLFLLQLNQRVQNATVYSFEPMPSTFSCLQKNAQHHNHLDLTLLNCGMSDAAGQATFHYFPDSPADSSRYPDDSEEARAQGRQVILNIMNGGSNIRLNRLTRVSLMLTPNWLKRWLAERVRKSYMFSRQVLCTLDTLSNIIDRHAIQSIDLLKMDIEGGEFDALAGLREEHWTRIRQMVLEVHGGESTGSRMAQLLERHGFQLVIEGDPLRPRNFLFFARRLG